MRTPATCSLWTELLRLVQSQRNEEFLDVPVGGTFVITCDSGFSVTGGLGALPADVPAPLCQLVWTGL